MCVFVHLWSVWQQKPGVIHRYAKDTILKNLFPPVLLRICISVCELKKSQPNAGAYNRPIQFFVVVFSCRFVVCRFCTSRRFFGYSAMKNQFYFLYPKINPLRWIYFYKSKTISGTGFLNFLPISELTLTVLISTRQYRSNESEVES